MTGPAPVQAVLPGGRRHFQHGPIDLVIEVFGAPEEVAAAYTQAWARFKTVLAELVQELPALRRPVSDAGAMRGSIAIAMREVCLAHGAVFLTSMAAVAGAVADAVLAALTPGRRLDKAYVNNGGDIALYLAPGQALRAGIVTMGATPGLDGAALIDSRTSVRGIATSGWRGRSQSLGIADSVTVLAGNAAMADVCATLIANAVDIEDKAIRRVPAYSLDPDSDLGTRFVTIGVGRLPPERIERALASGVNAARDMHGRGLIAGALLSLQGRFQNVGDDEVRLGTEEKFIIPGFAGLSSIGRIEARI
ncbi:MAG: UPF0280 family protein [Alphaproteobacteria bacterium]|nr:UPF0280 family protein [Alphaproteobacteria bacterium]